MNDVNNMKNSLRLYLIHNVPTYTQGTAKRDTRKIKEVMQKFEYDDDFIDNINNDFCLGWNTATDIILNMLSNMH